MIIDHSLGLVFLHVPKCAGTALRNAWQDAADRRMESFFDFGFDPVLQRQVDLAHQPLMDLRHRREWRFLRRYHVVACIRHPYQRLASACREYYRQKSRESELQMRRKPPAVNSCCTTCGGCRLQWMPMTCATCMAFRSTGSPTTATGRWWTRCCAAANSPRTWRNW